MSKEIIRLNRTFFLLFTYFITLFFFLLCINLIYLEGIPHVPDSVAYLFMAKQFANGEILSRIPISPQHFNFLPGTLSVDQGTWLFQYPFGHPILLTIGILIGFPNIIPPLVGTVFVLITYCSALKIYDKKTALFFLLLPPISPFFLENAASFMSHNTASLYLILSFFCIVYFIKKHPKNYLLLASGIFIGLLFNTRPLTALPFFVIFFFLILLHKKNSLYKTGVLFYTGGFALLFILWCLYNQQTTGNFLTPQYYVVNQSLVVKISDLNQQLLTHLLSNTHMLFKNFGPMLYNWPVAITWWLLLVPFLFMKANKWDFLLLIFLSTLPIAYFFYNGTFIMYGPRFWYEILPFAFLLTARSFSLLYDQYKTLTLVVAFFLVVISWGKLFSILPSTNPDFFSPLQLKHLRGINFINKGIINTIENNNIHNAVIFVKDCDGNWWCYGSVFMYNSPRLDTDIVYAKDLGTENKVLMEYFKNRQFYIIDHETLTIEKIAYSY